MDFKEQNEMILNAVRFLRGAAISGNGMLADAKKRVLAEFVPWIDSEVKIIAGKYGINSGHEEPLLIDAIEKLQDIFREDKLDYSRNEYQMDVFSFPGSCCLYKTT